MYSYAHEKVDDTNSMTDYLIIYAASIILAFFSQAKIPKIIRKLLVVFLVLTLSYLLLIRDSSIGTDTENYIFMLTIMEESVTSVAALTALNIEPGFVLSSYFLKLILNNDFIVLFCFALITYGFYIKGAIKNNLNLAIFIAAIFSYTGLYFMSFNVIRQCIALSIIFFGINFLTSNSNKKFIITCLVAAIFHYSAIICILFIPLYRYRNILYRNWYILAGTTIGSSYFFIKLIISLGERYSGYLISDDVTNLPSITMFSFYIFIFIFSILLFKFIDPKLRDHFKFYSVLYTIYISLCLFFYISGLSNQGLVRISLYFMWPIIFIIDFALKSIKDRNTRYFLNVLVITFLSFFFIYSLAHKGVELVPFKNNNKINLIG